ncbi:hypothetical protein BGX38DRAFT_1268814 [Terfezia claveryi]|nr:hypothetical protein BGX38DRAFT_1268814 [Terfezia claveryi]
MKSPPYSHPPSSLPHSFYHFSIGILLSSSSPFIFSLPPQTMEIIIIGYDDLKTVPFTKLTVTLRVAKRLLSETERGVELTPEGKDELTAQIIRVQAGNRNNLKALVICLEAAMFEYHHRRGVADEGMGLWLPD